MKPMIRLFLLAITLSFATALTAQDSLAVVLPTDSTEALAGVVLSDTNVPDSSMVNLPTDKEMAVPTDTTRYAAFPRVSLLTCTPGIEIWEQYGHTAIRYEDPNESIDVVFNYGLFSFQAPHFVWRFCTGKTDYLVGVEDYPYFEVEYLERGSAIKVQVLDLKPDEVARFWDLITTNCRKENRTYRYNFFYKNCSTMARDILYKSLDSTVVCAPCDSVTLRDILHEHNQGYPWSSFAVDLVLGTEADQPVDHDLQEFAPDRLHRTFSTATTGGRPLVEEENVIGPEVPLPDFFHFPLTPTQAMYVLLLLTAIFCVLDLLVERIQWGYDILLYGIQGIMGIVIAFLFFFSGHPAVDSNILVVLFNPLIWILLPFIIRCGRKQKHQWSCWVEIGMIVALAITELTLKQQIPPALWILTASLFLRTIHHILFKVFLLALHNIARG